ncbi:Transglutaminase-like superfamily protein [Sanguibacter gelidistatuariae]|uniref:Transglutaminase-like superfamily protein n=1 Tax=Sanguibacter gelidistatuariae TaxID=1814289 RepID=A0A1G6UPU8_9MICO|nr:transglutaminase domain-containing protein [Sanguibacter gelidistatuariae]SDD43313.1 Transglutaminase-like superfamily protein [Sanguibacter gelidistatuariae]
MTRTSTAPAPLRTITTALARRTAGDQLIDVVVMALAVLLALVPLVPVFGLSAAAPAIVGGVVLGALIAALAAVRRWPVVTTIAATLVVYAVFGGALAVPSTTSAGVLPGVDTLVALAEGVVTSWKQVLTLDPPLGSTGNALVMPYVLGLIAVVAAAGVAAGRKHPLRILVAPMIPAGVLVLSILFGTVDRTLATVIGASMAALLVVWAAWRRGHWKPRRAASLAVLAVLAIGGGTVVAPLVAGDVPRFVLRSVVVPPFDPREHASPLSAYRAFIKNSKETDLLAVSGLPEGGVVRLATMDSFDGVVWNVLGDGEPAASGSFRKVGDVIPTSVTGSQVTVDVEVLALDGVWLPTVGQTTEISFDGSDAVRSRNAFRFNDATGTGVLSTGLTQGEKYTLDAVIPAVPSDEEIGSARPGDVIQPAPVGVPDIVVTRSSEVSASATTAALVARNLETYLHDTGFFSHGIEASGDYPSLSGHGASRIAELLGADVMVGDAEQYASAMALMASQQGLPARVVIGFIPSEEQQGAEKITFTGDNMQAWVEVNYAGVGWVAYYPTPPTNQTPQENEDPVEKEPQPQVIQPPPPPADPVVPPKEDAEEPNVEANDEPAETGVDVRRIVLISTAVGVPLLLLLLPPLLIVAAKRRRRRRRQRALHPVARISGGWDEVLDTARDHGTVPPADATRRETARALAAVYPRIPATALAEHADAAVFSGALPTEMIVTQYWQTVDQSVAAISSEGTVWSRVRGRYSRASLRAAKQARKAARSAGLGKAGRVPVRPGRAATRR